MIDRLPQLSMRQKQATLDYLSQFADFEKSPADALAATFARCCLLTLDTPGIAIAQSEAETIAGKLLNHHEPNALGIDPMLLLSHLEILRDVATEVPTLTRIAKGIAEQVDALPADISVASRTQRIIKMLWALGLSDAPPKYKVARNLPEINSMIQMQIDKIDDLIDLAIAQDVVPTQQQYEILLYIALSELRSCRFDVACRILRFVMKFNYDSTILNDAINFLVLQRTRVGSYGFFNVLSEDTCEINNLDRSFSFPVTLNVVWTFNALQANLKR
jgi:hypothetical protein